jgi:hypothetical protein
MQIQEALGDIGVPKLAEIASEAPTLAEDKIVAAYVYEAESPPVSMNASMKIPCNPR